MATYEELFDLYQSTYPKKTKTQHLITNVLGSMAAGMKGEQYQPKEDEGTNSTRELLKTMVLESFRNQMPPSATDQALINQRDAMTKLYGEKAEAIVDPMEVQRQRQELMLQRDELKRQGQIEIQQLKMTQNPQEQALLQARLDEKNKKVELLEREIQGFVMPGAGGKPSAAAEKRAVEEQKLSDELGSLLNSFNRAKREGQSKVAGFGSGGLWGRRAGIEANLRGKAGYLPASNVYNAQRKAFATVVAKAAGEVRPTDEDINRFVETLPDIGKSEEENNLLISDIQEKVAQGGLANLWFVNRVGKVPQGQQQSNQISEDDIQYTMQKYGVTREEVLQRLGQ